MRTNRLRTTTTTTKIIMAYTTKKGRKLGPSVISFVPVVGMTFQFIVWMRTTQICASWVIPSSSSTSSSLRSSSRSRRICIFNRFSLVVVPDNHNNNNAYDGWKLDATVVPSDTYSEVNGDDDDDDETGGVDSTIEAWYNDIDVLTGEEGDELGLYGVDTLDDWIPDAEVARQRSSTKGRPLIPAKEILGDMMDTTITTKKKKSSSSSGGASKRMGRPSPYTEEEEDLINAMGGREQNIPGVVSRREDGFLGDSTLYEIAMDYSVPLCYLADVLAVWGVSVPINVHDRLGDLITGEQAFALVEAVNSLDVGTLQDRYSNMNLLQICDEWDIDIKDGFQFAMKEGWSLPFGVRTNLRVEQEDELLRVYSPLYRDVDDD
jgi:hypothetical protein